MSEYREGSTDATTDELYENSPRPSPSLGPTAFTTVMPPNGLALDRIAQSVHEINSRLIALEARNARAARVQTEKEDKRWEELIESVGVVGGSVEDVGEEVRLLNWKERWAIEAAIYFMFPFQIGPRLATRRFFRWLVNPRARREALELMLNLMYWLCILAILIVFGTWWFKIPLRSIGPVSTLVRMRDGLFPTLNSPQSAVIIIANGQAWGPAQPKLSKDDKRSSSGERTYKAYTYPDTTAIWVETADDIIASVLASLKAMENPGTLSNEQWKKANGSMDEAIKKTKQLKSMVSNFYWLHGADQGEGNEKGKLANAKKTHEKKEGDERDDARDESEGKGNDRTNDDGAYKMKTVWYDRKRVSVKLDDNTESTEQVRQTPMPDRLGQRVENFFRGFGFAELV